MSLFSKPAPAPTFEERIARALDLQNASLNVFRQAADDLDVASAEHLAVVEETQAQIDALTELQHQADDNAVTAQVHADTIRGLDSELYQRLRIEALRRKMTVGQLLNAIIRSALDEPQPA